jgi:hypothetical protein
MKLYLHEDELFPYLFIRTEEEVRQDDAVRAEQYRILHKSEMPPGHYREDRNVREVPEDLARELIALRKREEEILYDMELHIRRTRQAPVQEDWEPYPGDSV